MNLPDVNKLNENAVEMAAWTEALARVSDWSSAAADAIRNHIDMLVDNQARILGLSEDEITEINKQAETDFEAEIAANTAAVWRALEDAPAEVIAEIEKLTRRRP